MTWGEIGQLMSGAGVLMTSLCAGVTVTLISLYQKRRQWVDDFRTLYAEFWNDKDISQVRRWIVSNKLYHEVLKPVLTQRIEKGYNDLDEDWSMKIDMIDKFMLLIIQLEILEKSTKRQRQRTLIERFLFSKHWKDKASARPELREYLATAWKGELERWNWNAIEQSLKTLSSNDYQMVPSEVQRTYFAFRGREGCSWCRASG
jgi:hypothetical protein